MNRYRIMVRACSQLVAVWMGLLFLSGCSDSPEVPEPESPPFTGMQLSLLIPNGQGLKATMHSTLEEWSAQSGAACPVAQFDVSGDLAADIATVQKTDAQILVFPLAHTADYAASGLFQPIPQSELSSNVLNWSDVFVGLRQTVAVQGDRPTIVPLRCPSLVCYYRRDLLDAAGLTPPETWQDYARLLETRGDWSGGLPIVEPWARECLPTLFLAHSVAFAKHPDNYSLLFDVSTGEPLINRPGFVRGLEFMQSIAEKLSEGSLQLNLAEARQLILSGEAAMTFAYESADLGGGGSEGNSAGSSVSDEAEARGASVKLGFSRLPGTRQVFDVAESAWKTLENERVNRVAVIGWDGLGIAIRAGCTDREQLAVCQLLRRLTIDQLRLAFPAGARSVCRYSQVKSAAGWRNKSLDAQERALYVEAVANSLKSAAVVVDYSFVGRTRFRETLAAAIHQAISEQASAQVVLDQLAREWQVAMMWPSCW